MGLQERIDKRNPLFGLVVYAFKYYVLRTFSFFLHFTDDSDWVSENLVGDGVCKLQFKDQESWVKLRGYWKDVLKLLSLFRFEDKVDFLQLLGCVVEEKRHAGPLQLRSVVDHDWNLYGLVAKHFQHLVWHQRKTSHFAFKLWHQLGYRHTLP